MRPQLREETGRRVVVRYRLPDGSATDVIGDLQHTDSGSLVVLPDLAAAVVVPRTAVIAAKPVPGRVVRPRSRLELIARTMHRSWPGLIRRRLGGWILAVSEGFTRRANSALPVGDPGLPLTDAIEVVEGFFADSGLPAVLQIPTPLEGPTHTNLALFDLLASRGYAPDPQTSVMIRRLGADDLVAAGIEHVGQEQPDPIGADLRWRPQPDPDWLRLYGLPAAVRPELAQRVLTASSDHRFLTGYLDGQAIAAARLAVIDGWAGITALRVDAAHRHRGLGRRLLAHTLAEARRSGAAYAYLQVEGDSEAVQLYRRAGFAVHHHYRYWRRHADAAH